MTKAPQTQDLIAIPDIHENRLLVQDFRSKRLVCGS